MVQLSRRQSTSTGKQGRILCINQQTKYNLHQINHGRDKKNFGL